MFYARVQNQAIVEYPIDMGALRVRFPNISFPIPITEPPEGYVVVNPSEPPNPAWDENLTEGAPQLTKGQWHQTWAVTKASPEEIKSRLDLMARQAKRERDMRLQGCDWTQLPDARTNKELWAKYRQLLRDLTLQDGFPHAIQWPVEPS